MPDGTEFADLLVWAYRGEVSGEAIFDALADAWADHDYAERLRVLAELERRMARRLTPLLTRHELDGGDDERSRTAGRDGAAVLAGDGWHDFLRMFAPVTDDALVRYRRLQSMATQPDPAFDLLIAHEEALQAFSAAELAGDTEHALDPVRDVIARLSA